jgi:hypothetical protein
MDLSRGLLPMIAQRSSIARSSKSSLANNVGRNDKALKRGPQKSSESRRRWALKERNYSSCGSDADDESAQFETNEVTTLVGPNLKRSRETSSMRFSRSNR